MSEKLINSISARLSLRLPQIESLAILARICEIIPLEKSASISENQQTLSIIQSKYPSVIDFERDFPSLCFALATGVGKTRLMGAFIAYLHAEKKIQNFFVLAPNLTIYKKLIDDFTPNTPKYVFKGIAEFAQNPPLIITGDNYENANFSASLIGGVTINIFNISKINSEVRGGKSPRIKRLSELMGESYFQYLSNLPDLVMLMDECHHYRASAGLKALNELKPILGLELTATPFMESSGKTALFKNIIYHYPLARAMEDGFVKEPAVVTQKNFLPSQFSSAELEKIKLEDGIRVHENIKAELKTFALNSGAKEVKPFVLIIARDTTHAAELKAKIENEKFFEGAYNGKVIQIDSSQSGGEKEENITRLLAVENADEPTEIVIHVNMLKEGWDVTNLYTIIPLRAANARTLVEQSIGRGLRLPYGKRTGVSSIDRLNIIAHDKFQEIIDESNRSDSPLHIQKIELDNSASSAKKEAVTVYPVFEAKLKVFAQHGEAQAAQIAKDIMQNYNDVSGTEYFKKPDVLAQIAAEVEFEYNAQNYGSLVVDNIDIAKIVEKTALALAESTIDIPLIRVVPKTNEHFSLEKFSPDFSAINFKPVLHDIFIEHLRTRETETISAASELFADRSPNDFIVHELCEYDDISYDDESEALYDIADKLISHLKNYLKNDDDVKKVLYYYKDKIISIIHAQFVEKQNEIAHNFDVCVTRSWIPLKQCAFTKNANELPLDFMRPVNDKSKIAQYIFTGFKKCLYEFCKFDSDTERRFALILERESKKWFRPALGQFQIYYTHEGFSHEYEPDFVCETETHFLLIETKAKNEVDSAQAQAKKKAAETWCAYASDFNAAHGKKPWNYVLLADDNVKDNIGLKYFG